MASAYTITTTTNAITLDAERAALVAFTVSNQLGRSVRVRASVSPFAPAPPEWFRIDGEAERVFPPGGSDVFNVRIKAPPDATPGQNAFRLDAVSADRPDDEWAHGPLVGFEVPAPPDIPVPPPKVLTGYLETVLGALAGGAIAAVVVLISDIIILTVFGTPLQFFFQLIRIFFLGELTLGLALGGAVGAIVALVVRGVPDPAPWRTGVAFGALSMIVLTILDAILIKAILLTPPEPGLAATLVGSLVVMVVVALIARAIGRFMGFGRL